MTVPIKAPDPPRQGVDTNADFLARAADEIRRRGKRVVADIIAIGHLLVECNKKLPHGNWFFMRVFELAQSKSVNFADLSLPVSGLYLLAAPTTPEAARAEVIKRAKAGERLRHSDVTTIVDRTKGKKAHVDRTKGKQPASGTEPAPAVAVTTLNQTKTAPDSNKNKAEPTKAIPTSTNPNKSPPYAWMKALNPEVWMEALIVHAWNEAFPMDRSRALISIGLDALLAAIPEEWLPLIEEHAAERLLSIPPFLRRPMPKEPPA